MARRKKYPKLPNGYGSIKRLSGKNRTNPYGVYPPTTEFTEDGIPVPVDAWDTEQAEVILTFTKTESIDALIAELQDVKAMMDGSYPFENRRVRQKDLDFDAFMHIENDRIYHDFMKKGRE